MIFKSLMCLLVASFILNSSTASSLPALNPSNLRKLFDSAKPYADLTNAFYSVQGLHLLGEKVPQVENLVHN